MKFGTICSVLALLVLGGEAHAQEYSRRVRIIPSIGRYLPTGDIGYGGPEDGPEAPEFLSLGSGFAVGVAVEAPVVPILGIRGGIRYGFASDLVAGDDVGLESCGTDCSVVAYERTPLTEASALLLSADLAVRPAPPSWIVQPYALGGLAFRSHFYDESVIPPGRASRQAEEQAARWVPHLGVGAAWSVRSIAVVAEAEIFGDVEWHRWKPHGGRYGDAFISLGLRWSP